MKGIGYTSKFKAKVLKHILIALGLLLTIALILPFFIRLDNYIPQIEKEVFAKFKEPISIKSIRFTSFPIPHITVDGITFGTADDVRLGKVVVTPEISSLLRSTIVIKSIEINSLILTKQAIDKIPAWSKSESAKTPQQKPSIKVESIQLNNAIVNFDKVSFGPFDAHVSLANNGQPVEASITTSDGKLKVAIKPDQSNYLIDMSAKQWTLPIGPQIVFDELSIKGVTTLNDAKLSQVSAKLYGGTANGIATASWQKGLQFHAKLDVHQVEMQKIASMLSSKTHVSGRLNAKPILSASAASADQLINALHLDTPFNVQNGVLYGVDIQEAATGLIKKKTTGGETRFDQLSGHLAMALGGYRFTQLKIASGTLAADGYVNVSPEKVLSGRLNTHVKAVGASVPLNVTGTLDAPLLFPTGGTITGAAVGTMIMGPGVGTTVGAKVGGWVEGLFGKSKEQNPKK